MEFEGGVTAAFTMVAFTEKLCDRNMTIYGTKVGTRTIKLINTSSPFLAKDHWIYFPMYKQTYIMLSSKDTRWVLPRIFFQYMLLYTG